MNQTFWHTLSQEDVFFRYACGASVQQGKEFHLYNEIIWLLSDNAELITENRRFLLPADALLVIPKGCFHQLVLHGDPQDYRRCVLNFGTAPLPSFGDTAPTVRICQPSEPVRYLFGVLQQTATAPRPTPSLLPAVLTLLLHELPTLPPVTTGDTLTDSRIRRVVAYIDDHLQEPLTLAHLAHRFHLSESTLSHLFRAEMGLPLHRYILQKRLMQAHWSIAAGRPATEVAHRCGFGDYTGFYKQYKAWFGHPPSQTKKSV